jgi:hypothetical protein
LSIISEIAAKDPYSAAMALGQFPHILLTIAHIVYFILICRNYVKKIDMQREHIPLWFRILLIFRALKTVNTNNPNVTVEFSCDPDIFFMYSQFVMSLFHSIMWFIISCMASFYAGRSAQPGGMLPFP